MLDFLGVDCVDLHTGYTTASRAEHLPLAIQNIWPMLMFFEIWIKLQGQG
jgi:hypothetical protein